MTTDTIDIAETTENPDDVIVLGISDEPETDESKSDEHESGKAELENTPVQDAPEEKVPAEIYDDSSLADITLSV